MAYFWMGKFMDILCYDEYVYELIMFSGHKTNILAVFEV